MLFAVVTYGPCLYGHASTCIWQTDAHSDLSDIFSGFLHPAPKGVWWAYGWSDPLSQSRKCALFSVHSHQDRYRPGPAPLYDGHWHVSGKKIGCRRCFVHAADYRWYGKWSSRICSGCVPPLSGYFARAKKPAERGGAEDFSLTRGISAAELTHIDHERKRMTRYFKPLQKWRRTNVFPISLCHCITDSFLPIDIQLVWLVIYARFLYHYGITTLSLATWMGNRYSAYTYLYISILQIKQTINTWFPSL